MEFVRFLLCYQLFILANCVLAVMMWARIGPSLLLAAIFKGHGGATMEET